MDSTVIRELSDLLKERGVLKEIYYREVSFACIKEVDGIEERSWVDILREPGQFGHYNYQIVRDNGVVVTGDPVKTVEEAIEGINL